MIKLNEIEVKFETFPNGETRIANYDTLKIRQKFQQIIFKYENDSDLIKLMFLKKYLDRQHHGKEVVLFVTYMPYSRMDRSENYSPFTLKFVADFINSLNFVEVVVIEPHSDVTCALVNNSTPKYINFDLIEKVKQEVEFVEEFDYIVFPDAGASKRYSKMKAKNMLFCSKVRDFATGEIKGLDLVGDTSNAYGRTAIIVDDLSSYGGTFVHTANKLRQEGFAEVFLLVSHAENSIFKGKLFDHVDKVFTTNSILTEQDNWENAKFKEQLKIYDIEGVL